MQIALVILFCSMANLQVHQESDVAAALPSFNYWDLSGQLLRSLNLQRELKVSSEQLDAIKNMRARDDLKLMIRKESDSDDQERRKNKTISVEPDVAREKTLSRLDPIIGRELSQILSEFQIDQLKTLCLRAKFDSGLAPFYSREVISFCELTAKEQKELIAVLELERAQYVAQLRELRKDAATAFLDMLRPASRRLFAHYAGNAFTKDINIEADFPTDSIPFQSLVVPLSLASNVNLQKELGVTAEQMERMDQLEKFLTDGPQLFDRSKGQDFGDYMRAREQKIVQEARSMLSKPQRLLLSRILAMDEFILDFTAPFSRDEFLSYLALSEDEKVSIRKLAQSEFAKLKVDIRELNKRSFSKVCDCLPNNSKEKMREMFSLVW